MVTWLQVVSFSPQHLSEACAECVGVFDQLDFDIFHHFASKNIASSRSRCRRRVSSFTELKREIRYYIRKLHCSIQAFWLLSSIGISSRFRGIARCGTMYPRIIAGPPWKRILVALDYTHPAGITFRKISRFTIKQRTFFRPEIRAVFRDEPPLQFFWGDTKRCPFGTSQIIEDHPLSE